MNQQEIQAKHILLQLSYRDYIKLNKSLANTQLDKYYIQYEIGDGAYATVYKGINKQRNSQVAIKILNLRTTIELQKNPNLKSIKRRLAHSESRIMMGFNSPNIIKCYQCFQNRDLKIMILQYCNGGSLQEKIDLMKKIPIPEAISILKQIINGIQICHKMKVIHRDLKPANILIHNGQYKIADFGFSKQLDISNDNQMGVHTVLGTITTMAPQVLGKQDYGLKADIWSIGAIFFIMIFGKCPFKSDSTKEILLEMKEQFLAQQNYNGVVPSPKVKKFLKQVLQINPEQRLGWKQLKNHQLFISQEQSLPEEFYLQVNIEDNQQFSKEQENKIVQNKFYPSNVIDQAQQDDVSSQIEDYLQKNPTNQSGMTTIKNQIKLQSQVVSQQHNVQVVSQQYKQQIQTQQQQFNELDQQKIEQQNLNPQKRSLIMVDGIRILNRQKIQKLSTQVNRQEQDLYKWSQQTYIECLKTQVIFQKIVSKIQSYKIFDLENRFVIEMMYLICTRCLNNILPIFYQYQKRKNNSRVIKDLHTIINKLYEKVKEKYLIYSMKLTNKQDQKVQIVIDFWKKMWKKSQIINKDRFLTGVQNMAQFKKKILTQSTLKIIRTSQKQKKIDEEGLLDYEKFEQIQFTAYYIDKVLAEMKINKQFIEIQKHLRHYLDICKIRKEDLTDKTFQNYVKFIIM